MKSIYFIALFLITITVNAQTKEELFESFANETCECILEEKLDSMTKDEVKRALGLCMLDGYEKEKEKFLNYGVKFDSYESGIKLGKLVGVEMALICPEVFKVFIDDKDAAEEEEPIKFFTGTIKSISGDDFNYVYLEDENNKTHKFLWLRNFEGSSRLMENSKLKSKVIIYFENIECFIPKMNDYYSLKEITKIEFL